VLHLPLRYEDETRLVPLATSARAKTVQVEGEVVAQRGEVAGRAASWWSSSPTARAAARHAALPHFYPSQVEAAGAGTRGCASSATCAAAVRRRDGAPALPRRRHRGAPLPDR
jgi:ATP-dependent DNA helicase RecG